MLRNLLLGTAMAVTMAGTAFAVPAGSFSADGRGSYFLNNGTAATATTATQLDFGMGSGIGGNGFGTAGMININAGTGSFAGYVGSTAAIADLQFAGAAGTGTTISSVAPAGAFITFASPPLSLTILSSTVNAVGNFLFIDGTASYTDSTGTSNGTFTLSTAASNVNGVVDNTRFSFTTNAGAIASVPEPMSLALLGTGLVGLGVFARRRRS